MFRCAARCASLKCEVLRHLSLALVTVPRASNLLACRMGTMKLPHSGCLPFVYMIVGGDGDLEVGSIGCFSQKQMPEGRGVRQLHAVEVLVMANLCLAAGGGSLSQGLRLV
jgi:hypothetical protein